MNKRALYALPEDEGKRMDKYLSEQLPDKTRSFLAKLCGDGRILVNGAVQGKNYKLKAGDSITVEIPAPVSLSAEPEDIPLDIVYEDGDLLVVNKPKGMVVHPAAGNYSHTLVNALLYHCGGSLSGIGGVVRPGIVHRIDKDTSGLLIIAKNDRAHQGLAGQIKEHSFTREYETVVHGNIKTDEGTVDAPLGRHPSDRKKMAVTQNHSRNAVSHYQVLERFGSFTHLAVRLETGRTHQIRVHMAYLGHPVAGDEDYGPKKAVKGLAGQCLHARKIGFIHPVTGKYLEFTSDLPPYFTAFLEKLRKEAGFS